VLSLLLSLPVVLWGSDLPPAFGVVGLAGLGPLAMGVAGQLVLRRDWLRLVYLPALMLLGIGLAVSNTQAAWQAFARRTGEFRRTPKAPAGAAGAYAIPLDWTTWAEAALTVYALATGLLALTRAPGLAPMAFLYALAFGVTAALGFWQSRGAARRAPRRWTVGAARSRTRRRRPNPQPGAGD
jgi:hypothetical protein